MHCLCTSHIIVTLPTQSYAYTKLLYYLKFTSFSVPNFNDTSSLAIAIFIKFDDFMHVFSKLLDKIFIAKLSPEWVPPFTGLDYWTGLILFNLLMMVFFGWKMELGV